MSWNNAEAHKHSSNHRVEIEASARCGCFFCRGVFAPTAITEWVDDDSTALCPKCGVDSVIGEASGLPATQDDFLSAMHSHWFN